jgi:hypothetical protein
VNLQLHAANAILLYVAINQLLSSQRVYSLNMRQQTAALCAIFFAVHPTRAAITTQAFSIDDSLSLSLWLDCCVCSLSLQTKWFTCMLQPLFSPLLAAL